MKHKTRLVCVLLLAVGAFAVFSPASVQAQARPATSTREVAPPGHEPYSTSFAVTLTSGNGINGFSPDPVPLNKRLVIEFVSVRVFNNQPGETPAFALADAVNGHSIFYMIPLTPAGGGQGYTATQLVRLYNDGNGVNGPGAHCLRDQNSFTTQTCSISLSGYLIDK